jgi:hypothetical protein
MLEKLPVFLLMPFLGGSVPKYNSAFTGISHIPNCLSHPKTGAGGELGVAVLVAQRVILGSRAAHR